MSPRIVLLSLVFCFTTSHPTTVENETSRVPRQLDFEDCCPCPQSKSNNPGVRDQDMLADTTGEGARSVDDCPCRFRDADSYGSPSILFPSSMRPERPFVRPTNTKEDPKNLLQPEVGLANSVLETIRKATSEEYQEALARDAARSAAKTDYDDSLLNDDMPAESSRNIVTIILNQKETDSFDDVMSEASHIKESRCIHPSLGSYRPRNLDKMRMPTSQPTHLMKEIFKFPKPKQTGLLHRNLLDMDSYVGASNIQEHVVMGNNRLRYNRPILKQNKNNDIDKIPSNKQDEFQNIKETPSLRLATTENKLLQRPAFLRNLLKLKDVEIIPSKISDEKFKFSVPKLRLTPLINRKTFNTDTKTSNRKSTDLSDLLRNGLKFNLNNRKPFINDQEEKLNAATSNTNIQIIPRPRDEIVDTIPSPSNIEEQFESHNIIDKDCGNEVTESTGENDLQIIKNSVMNDENNKPYESCESDGTTNNNIISNSEEIKLREKEKIQVQDSNEIVSTIQENEIVDEESNEPIINSNEFKEESNANQDSIVAPNNDVEHILPMEEKDLESISSSLEQEIGDVKETCDDDVNKNEITNAEDQVNLHVLKIKPVPLTETLTTIKEKVLKTLDDLKKSTSIIKPELSRDVKTYSLVENNEETEGHLSADRNKVIDLDYDNEESEIVETASKPVLNKEPLEDSIDAVTTRDLQELSDSILEASTKKEDAIGSNSEVNESISEEIENKTEKAYEIFKYQDSGTSATTQNEVLLNTDVNDKNTGENVCISDLGSSNAIQNEEILQSSSTLDKHMRTPDEMTAEASSSILDSVNSDPLGLLKANNNLRSILLPDIIVQPSSILSDELNIFRQPPVDLGDIFNLKTSLPTLEDIKLQLSSIFNTNERDASDGVSYEVGYDRDRTRPEMVSAASSSNFQSKLPSLKRLEDVNLDIFQMKPLTMAQSGLIPNIPRLNLNSYRAKLAIPKAMDLKPIKLQSALGDKAGVLGATLTIVPDELKIKPLLKSNIDTRRILPDLLSNSLGSVPSLDELHDTMRSNVQSLINNPLEKSSGSILDNSLRSSISLDIPHSIKAHAENTIKDMQKTIKVLKAKPSNDLSNFADTIKKPEDLVELASRTREDLNDKLKALHYDLNDRLTSIRESIIDDPILPSLNAPAFTRNENRYTGPKSNSIMRNKSSTPKTSNRNNLSRRIESQNKITTSRNGKLGETKVKTYKMSPAASVPVPKSVEAPKLKSTSTKSPNVRSEPNLKPKFKSFEPMPGISSFARQPAKSAFGFTKSPLNSPGPFQKETKVTISFTTTPRPTKSKSATIDTEDTFSFTPIYTTSRPEFDVTKTKPLLLKDLSKEKLPSLLTDYIGSKAKSSASPDGSITTLSRGSKGGTEIKTWPSVSDNTFLTKVREAVKARLANFKPVTLKDRPNYEDMARSPSENVETVLGEPLKENVSYKCKMVCTKE